MVDIRNMDYEYDNIMNLATKHNLKKIIVMRNSWSNGNWCIVNKVVFKNGLAYGHVHYKDGNKPNGSISCAGTFALRVIKVLEEELEVEYLNADG